MSTRFLTAIAVVACAVLGFADMAALGALGVRLAEILVFLAAISITVNLAASAGAFTALTEAALRILPARRWVVWTLIVVLAAVATAFLSLDTTAVMVTPLAVALARRSRLPVLPTALTVAWIANAGSLFLPVSNLTNLLAGATGILPSTATHIRAAWLPATVALVTVIVYAAVVTFRHRVLDDAPGAGVSPGSPGVTRVRPGVVEPSLAVLAILVPVLATPLPYWMSTTVAAVIMLILFWWRDRTALSVSLVPWGAIWLTIGLSAVAEFSHVVGGAEALVTLAGPLQSAQWGPAVLAVAGAMAANLVNNLPAYLLLEPIAAAAASPRMLVEVLIGVNAGPLVTPWASLATILWADQLRRTGVEFRWGTWVRHGLVLAPLAVGLPVVAAVMF